MEQENKEVYSINFTIDNLTKDQYDEYWKKIREAGFMLNSDKAVQVSDTTGLNQGTEPLPNNPPELIECYVPTSVNDDTKGDFVFCNEKIGWLKKITLSSSPAVNADWKGKFKKWREEYMLEHSDLPDIPEIINYIESNIIKP